MFPASLVFDREYLVTIKKKRLCLSIFSLCEITCAECTFGPALNLLSSGILSRGMARASFSRKPQSARRP